MPDHEPDQYDARDALFTAAGHMIDEDLLTFETPWIPSRAIMQIIEDCARAVGEYQRANPNAAADALLKVIARATLIVQTRSPDYRPPNHSQSSSHPHTG